MRDVKRCTKLQTWFKNHLIPRNIKITVVHKSKIEGLTGKDKQKAHKQMRKKKKKASKSQTSEISGDSISDLRGKVSNVDDNLASIILALAVCYHTRLGTTDLRQEYRGIIQVEKV